MLAAREFLRRRANRIMLGWVALVLVGTVAFVLLELPYLRMPDLSNTSWHELTRGVAPGDEGAHQRDDPYFILGTNESLPSAMVAIKARLASQGWRVDKDPAPLGGVTFVRTGDAVLSFTPFPSVTLSDLEDYSVPPDRLREWHQHYAQVYILEMFFP